MVPILNITHQTNRDTVDLWCFDTNRRVGTSVLYWLLERCQYSILVAFASILKILQYPGGCQYTGSGGQYTGSGCLTYCHYMAVRLVLLQCFGVLH